MDHFQGSHLLVNHVHVATEVRAKVLVVVMALVLKVVLKHPTEMYLYLAGMMEHFGTVGYIPFQRNQHFTNDIAKP